MFPARSAPAAGPLHAQLDAEKLHVYAVAIEFQTLAATLSPKGQPVLRDQLERASLSIALNIAEGAGRRSRPDKNRFYGIARGSANECAAVIDLLRVRGLASEAACSKARELLVRIVQMLTKLQQRMAG
jgi:four helix bundle protein